MKKHRKKASHRLKSTAYRQSSTTVLSELEPEEFADYVRRAEKRALPTIKEKRLGPAAPQLLLVQLAQLLGGVIWFVLRCFHSCSMPLSGRSVLFWPFFRFTVVRIFSTDFSGLTVTFGRA
ncbi:MAG: hypothetical protein ACXWPS_07635 [Ktedonobacteraceae bacterium]